MADKKEDKANIQWYPGHMTKARRMMEENISMVDAVCEVIDARIPAASRNPDVDEICAGKPRLVILNRTDLADAEATAKWSAYLKRRGYAVLETDARSGRGVASFPTAVRTLLKERIEAFNQKGQTGRLLRVMIIGIPNVGKSTFINKLAGRKAAAVSDRPGVTRGKQWITIGGGIELLDTPGILWPRFDSRRVGELLALTGAVKDDILDREALASTFLETLMAEYPSILAERYKITTEDGEHGWELLEAAAKKRGFLLRGGEFDTERMSIVLLDEYRAGKLGRLTLETPDEN